ncbi:hypothetical protein MOMA_06191 [Moraxella macacae 0408225]|uniref:YadA domain-containing protein n=1 Tax=Moraxella macacae 0408225 TaxID=1230338 RepID=L2F6R6_9GAMM|nr:YadA-like family protein [Moraxella macacae]ELA08128.1 hypothetical protein MOMA_06191 [Moraxella macacae 0408225]
MNHIYKVIFNQATNTFMAVAEYAKSHTTSAAKSTTPPLANNHNADFGQKFGRTALAVAMTGIMVLMGSGAWANDVQDEIKAKKISIGDISITSAQGSQGASVDFHHTTVKNIGKAKTNHDAVNLEQLSSSTVTFTENNTNLNPDVIVTQKKAFNHDPMNGEVTAPDYEITLKHELKQKIIGAVQQGQLEATVDEKVQQKFNEKVDAKVQEKVNEKVDAKVQEKINPLTDKITKAEEASNKALQTFKVKGDDNDDSKKIEVSKNNSEFTITGGQTGSSDSKNITVTADKAQKTLTVKLAKDLKGLDSVTTGNSQLNNGGLSVISATGQPSKGIQVGADGIKFTNGGSHSAPTVQNTVRINKDSVGFAASDGTLDTQKPHLKASGLDMANKDITNVKDNKPLSEFVSKADKALQEITVKGDEPEDSKKITLNNTNKELNIKGGQTNGAGTTNISVNANPATKQLDIKLAKQLSGIEKITTVDKNNSGASTVLTSGGLEVTGPNSINGVEQALYGYDGLKFTHVGGVSIDGSVRINKDGIGFSDVAGSLDSTKPKLTKTGLDMGSQKITNVKNAENDNDAVNYSQFKQVKSEFDAVKKKAEEAQKSLKNLSWNLKAGDNGNSNNVTSGNTVTFKGDDNIKVSANGDSTKGYNVNYTLNKTLTGLTSVSAQSFTAGGVSITSDGIKAGNKTISGVGNAKQISDAVNLQQLASSVVTFTENNQQAKPNADIIVTQKSPFQFDPNNGSITTPDYEVTLNSTLKNKITNAVQQNDFNKKFDEALKPLNQKATEAQTKANQAATSATTAQQSAKTAQTAAQNAKTQVTEAGKKVTAAEESAKTATQKATQAETSAKTAKELAESAKGLVTTAQGEVTKAQENAKKAQTEAEQAKAEAQKATTASESAKQAAEQAKQTLGNSVQEFEVKGEGNNNKITINKTNKTLTVKGGQTDDNDATSKNISVVSNTNDKTLTVKLAKELKGLTSVTTGNSQLNSGGLSIISSTNTSKKGIQIGADGIKFTDGVSHTTSAKNGTPFITQAGYGFAGADGNIDGKKPKLGATGLDLAGQDITNIGMENKTLSDILKTAEGAQAAITGAKFKNGNTEQSLGVSNANPLTFIQGDNITLAKESDGKLKISAKAYKWKIKADNQNESEVTDDSAVDFSGKEDSGHKNIVVSKESGKNNLKFALNDTIKTKNIQAQTKLTVGNSNQAPFAELLNSGLTFNQAGKMGSPVKNKTVYGVDGIKFTDNNNAAVKDTVRITKDGIGFSDVAGSIDNNKPNLKANGLNMANQKISNLQSGEIAENSNEAVSGAKVAKKIEEVKTELKNTFTSTPSFFKGDTGVDIAGGNAENKITHKLGDTLTISGSKNGSNAIGDNDLTYSNVAVKADKQNNRINIGLRKDLSELNSATFGNNGNAFKVDSQGMRFLKSGTNGSLQTDTDKPNLTATGLDMGGQDITNIGTDRKSLSQIINNFKDEVKGGSALTLTGQVESKGKKTNVAVIKKGGKYYQIGANGAADTSKEVQKTNVHADIGGVKISGLANGNIAENSTDAVTGGQIHTLQKTLFGNGAGTASSPVAKTKEILTEDGKSKKKVQVVASKDEKGKEHTLKTYNVQGQTEYVTNNVVQAISKMNEQGIKYFHTNDGETDVVVQSKNEKDSSAGGSHASAIGFKAIANGKSSLAIGDGSQALSQNTVAIGAGNIVSGQNSGAIGDPSYVLGSNSYVLGNDNGVNEDTKNAFVIGNKVKLGTSNLNDKQLEEVARKLVSLSGRKFEDLKQDEQAKIKANIKDRVLAGNVSGATAFGNETKVKVAGGVAIGEKSDAKREKLDKVTLSNTAVKEVENKGTVTVNTVYAATDAGSETGKAVLATTQNSQGAMDIGHRQITSVAAGSADSDAVNVAQLRSVASTAALANQNLVNAVNDLGYRLDTRIGKTEDNANAGISSAMAMASMPQAYLPGKSMVSGGMASYNGQGAVAVGISKLSDNGRWVIKVNGSADTQGNAGAAVGAGFHW